MPDLPRLRQHTAQLERVQHVGRIGDRHRLPDRLLGREAGQPFGAAIPADDDPVRIEKDDGMRLTVRESPLWPATVTILKRDIRQRRRSPMAGQFT